MSKNNFKHNFASLALLLIGCSGLILIQQATATASTLDDSNGNLELYYQTLQDGYQQQRQENQPVLDQSEQFVQNKRQTYEEGNQEIPKRVLFKDGDGYSFQLPAEQRRLMKLRELLDSLDMKPIFRTGRIYPSLGANLLDAAYPLNAKQATRSQAFNGFKDSDKNNKLASNNGGQAINRKKIIGFNFPTLKSQVSASKLINQTSSGKQAPASGSPLTRQQAAAQRLAGSEEVAFTTPLHGISDYEWKRVENTRWNNLRGMWGRR